jgi:hypothetical protein
MVWLYFMSAHKKRMVSDPATIRSYNTILKHFLLGHFVVVPQLLADQTSLFSAQIVSEGCQKIQGLEAHPAIAHFLEFIDGLAHKLLTIDPAMQCSWNYLGTPETKEKYLAYLEQTFWTLQNETTIQKSPLLAQMTEHPWMLSGILSTIEGTWQKPADFFDAHGTEFQSKIAQTLSPLWIHNPSLITDPLGAFCWKIVCHTYTFSGYIQRHDTQLFHWFEITF